MMFDELRNRIEGTVATSTDSGYDTLRRGLLWNQLTPPRSPRLIVQVATEQDVLEAVRFAGAHGMKVSVRSGGHSWVGLPLRDESLLIDLGRLRRCSIDAGARLATVQPAVTGRELNNRLDVHGLAFPVGHCPSVALGGFLLNGGLGWNSGRWGPACFSVESANVITADGDLVVTDTREKPDLLWALRGAGPGFFGVVTQYRLKLYASPRAITTSTYFFPLQDLEAVGSRVAHMADRMSSDVELAIFLAPAPADLQEPCRSTNGFVGMLSATAFFDTGRESSAALGLLDDVFPEQEWLQKEVTLSDSIGLLLDRNRTFWPDRHRYMADTVWSNSPPSQVLAMAREHFLRAPSAKSLALCAFPTGGGDSVARFPDAAFSMKGRTLLLCYAIWEQPDDDAANASWHHKMMAALEPFGAGHYVGESDIVSAPSRAEKSFAHANWQRLQSLHRKYDPDDRFHGYFSV